MATRKKAAQRPAKAVSKGAKAVSKTKTGRNTKRRSTALATPAKKTPATSARKQLANKAGARKSAATTAAPAKVIAKKSVTEEIVIERAAGTRKSKRLVKKSTRRIFTGIRGGTTLWDATKILDFEPEAPTESGTDDGGYGIKSDDDT